MLLAILQGTLSPIPGIASEVSGGLATRGPDLRHSISGFGYLLLARFMAPAGVKIDFNLGCPSSSIILATTVTDKNLIGQPIPVNVVICCILCISSSLIAS